MISEEIKKIVEGAVKKLGSINMPQVLVEIPKDKTHGDYVTNVSFELAKVLKRNPNEVANLLKSQIEKNEIFKKVEVVGGFLNFFVKEKLFTKTTEQILKQKDKFGKTDHAKNFKVMVEYTDPNPFKVFHIGHMNSNAIGESISRIFEFNGAKIKRACYQGDVGRHVARAIWGKTKDSTLTWGKAYAYGAIQDEDSEDAKKEISEINKKIYEKSDPSVNRLYDQGKKETLADFENVYKILGTKFDYYFFESQMAPLGKKMVQDGLKKNIFETGENGAIIFKGEKFGTHTRVFINSEGLPTYEAKELALAQEKYKKYKYDWSVVITGNEVNDYFKVLLSALSQIFPDLAKKTKHMGHGMMRLPEGKMSSRTGNVITFESLLQTVEQLVMEKVKERDLSSKEKEEIMQKVAVGALKYSILKQSTGSDIIYDAQKSVSFEGDSGPYLQYSYARAMSILKKAKAEKISASLKKVPAQISQLEKDMNYFPEIVQKAGKELEPHIIAGYLTELAREFNAYYANNKIVDKHDEFSGYKVALTQAFSIIMKNGLWLLGIEAPEKM